MDLFCHDFKFDLTLPSPIPDAKYTFYPFQGDRYTHAHLTNLNFMEKPQVYTTVDLGIKIDDLNIRPELFTPKNEVDVQLDEADILLFGDLVHINKKKLQQQKLQQELALKNMSGELMRQESEVIEQPEQDIQEVRDRGDGIDLSDSMLRVDQIESFLRKSVEDSFSKAASLNVTEHPNKPGVKISRMIQLVPNFQNIDIK